MPPLKVRCPCGHVFAVEGDPGSQKKVSCPACSKSLAIRIPAPKPALSVVPPPESVPAPAPSSPPPPANKPLLAALRGEEVRKVKMLLLSILIGGVAGMLILGVISLITSGGKQNRSLTESDPYAPIPRSEETSRNASRAPARARSDAGTVRKTREDLPDLEPLVIPDAPLTPKPPEDIDLPPDIVARVHREILSLPPFYLGLCLTADDRTRVESLIKAGRGCMADADFLREILSDGRFEVAREEMTAIDESFSRVETTALQGLPEDRVELTDDRTLEGKLVGETPEEISLERRVGGAKATLRLKRAEVRKVEKGQGIGAEFARRWDAAKKGTTPEKIALLGWCKEQRLVDAARLVAYLVLKADPGHQDARTVAGLPKTLAVTAKRSFAPLPAPVESYSPPAGEQQPAAPVQPAPQGIPVASAAGPKRQIEYEGKTWEAMDLKERLIGKGFVVIGGRWYSSKKRSVSISSLTKYESQDRKPVAIQCDNAVLTRELKISTKKVLDINTKEYRDVEEGSVVCTFYSPVWRWTNNRRPSAGVALGGEVTLSIPLGAPVLEASAMLTAELGGGGKMDVYAVVDSRREKSTLVSSRKEEFQYDLPASVRGQETVVLVVYLRDVVRYSNSKESRIRQDGVNPDGYSSDYTLEVGAKLFPSRSNTREVFCLTATVGEPAEGLNRLFEGAGALDVLR